MTISHLKFPKPQVKKNKTFDLPNRDAECLAFLYLPDQYLNHYTSTGCQDCFEHQMAEMKNIHLELERN